jgi:hypothetical protein
MYLGTIVTIHSDIRNEIKSRLNLGNACCDKVQNLLLSFIISKNLKVEVKLQFYMFFHIGVKLGPSP